MSLTLINAALAIPKKPSKELVQEYLRDLYGQHPDAVYQLSQIYNYFMPSAPAKAKTAFQWVARSCGDNDARAGLNFVWVDGEGFMVATNGHMLHMAPTTLARGYYHPKTGEPCNCDYIYPDWRRVVPVTPSKELVGFMLRMADTTTYEVQMKNSTMHVLQVPTDYGVQGFDRKYVLAALNGRTESRGYISTRLDHAQMVLVDGDRTAVIMGTRS